MKFFLDTANLAQIKEANELGVLDGVTTNPTLMAKEELCLKNGNKSIGSFLVAYYIYIFFYIIIYK